MKTDRAPFLVEMFGHPGAGKSTLAHAAEAGRDFRSTAELGSAWKRRSAIGKAALLAAAVTDLGFIVRSLRLVVAARLLSGDSLRRLARLTVKTRWVRAQRGRLLLQEGFLQDLWSILYSARRLRPDPARLVPLIRQLYRGIDARIVYIDVDPRVAFDRIRGRTDGKSRLDRLSDDELRRQLGDAAELPARLVAAARAAGLQVERFDGALPLQTLADQLRSMVAAVDDPDDSRNEAA